jgi:chromosomal replication initiator protein
VFLVDDVQFIAGKGQDKTKEEFFHTFNTLHQTGKQVVICSDRPPKELQMMDERLRSRFECGLVADIAPPDLETRLAILQKKAIAEHTRIPDDVLLYMAKLIQSNIRALEGALVKLVAQASLTDSPVTTELAASILGRYFIAAGIGADGESVPIAVRKDEDSPLQQFATNFVQSGGDPAKIITATQIKEAVARHFNLDEDTLIGKKRDKEIAMARQIAMHLMRELTEMSLIGIGNAFGGRDHSTVMHSCEKVKNLLPSDATIAQTITDLTTQLRAQTMH